MEKNLRTYYIKNDYPQVNYIGITIPKGVFSEPLNKKGIHNYLDRNLLIFSEKKEGLLKKYFDKIGAQGEVSSFEENTIISLEVMEENLKIGLELLLDSFFFPIFDDNYLKITKKNTLGEFNILISDPQAIAERNLFNFVFGSNHPMVLFETRKSIKKMEKKDLIEEYNKLIDTKNWGLFISSPMEEEKAKEIINEVFSKYKLKNEREYSLPKFKKRDKPIIRVIPKKEFTQIYIGFLIFAPPRISTNYPEFKISFYTFAEGGFSSMLLQKIRVEQGSTYDLSGKYEAFKETGYLFINGMVKKEDFEKIIKTIEESYQDWKTKGPKEEEIEEAKNFLIKNLDTIKDDPLTYGSFLLKNHIHNLDENFLEFLKEKIKEVDREKILNSHSILPEKIPYWCFLGDEKIIKSLAKNIGEVEVKGYFDLV